MIDSELLWLQVLPRALQVGGGLMIAIGLAVRWRRASATAAPAKGAREPSPVMRAAERALRTYEGEQEEEVGGRTRLVMIPSLQPAKVEEPEPAPAPEPEAEAEPDPASWNDLQLRIAVMAQARKDSGQSIEELWANRQEREARSAETLARSLAGLECAAERAKEHARTHRVSSGVKLTAESIPERVLVPDEPEVVALPEADVSEADVSEADVPEATLSSRLRSLDGRDTAGIARLEEQLRAAQQLCALLRLRARHENCSPLEAEWERCMKDLEEMEVIA